MAAASFLRPSELEEARNRFVHLGPEDLGYSFSQWLEEKLFQRLSALPGWEEARPIALGSWAREELCPKSDIDLLFCGSSEAAQMFMQAVQEEGLKVRSRVPQNEKNWTVGVEAFDVFALLQAKVFFPDTQELLFQQQSFIQQAAPQWKKQLLSALKSERKERARRHDSVTHFLEPNIKYGPGGLRDLQQAFTIMRLFPKAFSESSLAQEWLNQDREFLLALRQRLHLLGGSDVLSASEQLEISKNFHFSEVKLFARELQLSLGRVSFFSEWCLERIRLSRSQRQHYDQQEFGRVSDILTQLHEDPHLGCQWNVRTQVDVLWEKENPSDKAMGRWLTKYLDLNESEEFLRALFRSRILEKMLPDLARIKGLVQHDHYHRYTLDAHILQGLKLLRRYYKSPKGLGPLQFIVKEFDSEDWKILTLAGLFHDLGKGLGGDHSSRGSEIVDREFSRWGFSEKWTQEVKWLVENHLILSTAAFRRNPNEPSTWKWLHSRGVEGRRLRRLALWTSVDIEATNPEAWTSWKQSLLAKLVQAMESEGADRYRKFLQICEEKGFKPSDSLAEEMDLTSLENLPLTLLVQDLKRVSEATEDEPLLVRKSSEQRCWVRFHRKEDRKGLFFEFVRSLYGAGCVILQSSVRTLPQIGVYDWFLVKTSKTPAQLKKTLSLLRPDTQAKVSFDGKFDQIHLISQSEEGWVISFRGRDRRGMLLAAAQALFDQDFEILWAKVHTWGRQVDDVFCVRRANGLGDAFDQLQSLWQVPERMSFQL